MAFVPESLPRLPLARRCAWTFSKESCTVRVIDTRGSDPYTAMPAVLRFFDDTLCRGWLLYTELGPAGRAAGQADELTIEVGGGCTLGYEDRGDIEWVHVHYAHLRLWVRWDSDDEFAPFHLIWDAERGWLPVRDERAVFGLTWGNSLVQKQHRQNEHDEVTLKLSAMPPAGPALVLSELAEALQPPRQPAEDAREPRPVMEIKRQNLACPRCGLRSVWSPYSQELPLGIDWYDPFCLACDLWVYPTNRKLRPERPSDLTWRLKLSDLEEVDEPAVC